MWLTRKQFREGVFARDNNVSSSGVQADSYDNNDGLGLQFIGGRLGTAFELNVADILTTISVYFKAVPNDVEFDFSVYEDFDLTDTTGTILFTTELFAITAGRYR